MTYKSHFTAYLSLFSNLYCYCFKQGGGGKGGIGGAGNIIGDIFKTKLAIKGAILGAIKAIKGGIIQAKGKIIKTKGNLIAAKGGIIEGFGRGIAEKGKGLKSGLSNLSFGGKGGGGGGYGKFSPNNENCIVWPNKTDIYVTISVFYLLPHCTAFRCNEQVNIQMSQDSSSLL